MDGPYQQRAADPSSAPSQPPCTNDGPCTYQINGGGSSVNLRTAPNATASIIRSIPDGSGVTVLCSVAGDSVAGPFGTTTRWDRMFDGTSALRQGYMSDAFVGVSRYTPC
jgi:hypothetical protein